MSEVDGAAELRAGSEDPLTWQLLEDDGVTPIPLSARTDIELIIVNWKTGEQVKSFKESAPEESKKLFVTDAPNGKIQLRQEAEDFPDAAKYGCYVIMYDAVGAHPIPDGRTPDGEKYYRLLVTK